jgi:hypothetical protein
MAAPIWQTPAGFIGSVTQLVSTSTTVQAQGADFYKIINGSIPRGLIFLADGTLYGRPFAVGQNIQSQFTVRATNAGGVSDRTFLIDTIGHEGPLWVTPAGQLPVGLFGNSYAMNNEIVDYQLSAEIFKLPDNKTLTYYISDKDGALPPGLSITPSGRIIGKIKDTLLIDYEASNLGGYDEEPYDAYPYDHVGMSSLGFTNTPRYIPKKYQFYVSVSDGNLISKRLFFIEVQDPSNFRVDGTFIDVDTSIFTADVSYLLSPQWLTPANLGVVRANNNISIKLDVYDFEPYLGPTSYDWNARLNQNGSPSIHPPGLNLSPNTGVIYGSLPYQPAFNIPYTFTVNVTKTDRQNLDVSTSSRTFSLIIKGALDNNVNFISTATLGEISPGYVSELKIEADYVNYDAPLLYTLVDGHLPDGLTLRTDGTITGRAGYDIVTTFDLKSQGYEKFTLDGGQTTVDRYYSFVVGVGDIYQQGISTSTFRIKINPISTTTFTQIYAQPFLPLEQRKMYRGFISDTYTFDPATIYRPQDANFGVQRTLKMNIEFGIERLELDTYFTEALTKYFSRKRFIFGNVMYSPAYDDHGNYVYDAVYVKIIDPQLGGEVSTSTSNILNMKNILENMTHSGIKVQVDNFQLPRFMKGIEPATGTQLGYILVAPICYAVPGKGATIVEKIGIYGFKFNELDFTIDRLILQDNLTYSGAKYLMFPTKDSSGNNLGESLSYFNPDNIPGNEVLTADGFNLYLE